MAKTSMHEHVSKKLPPLEFLGFIIVKTKHVIQIDSLLLKYNRCQKKNAIDNEQILYNFREKTKTLWSVLFHKMLHALRACSSVLFSKHFLNFFQAHSDHCRLSINAEKWFLTGKQFIKKLFHFFGSEVLSVFEAAVPGH